MSVTLVFTIICIVVLFILSLITLILYNSKKEIPKDRVYVVNFLRQYTKGNYAKGYLISIKRGPTRSLVEYIPTDINYDKNQKIETQKVIVENNKIIPMMKGSLSDNEGELWLLPPTSNDFPNEFKEIYFGKKIMKITEDINEKTEENEIIKLRMEAQNQLLRDVKGLNLVRDYIKQDKELMKDIMSKTVKDEKQTFKPPYNQS